MSLHVDARPTAQKRSSLGRMTAVMRAATPTTAKVLRVATVYGGRIIEERVFRDPRRGTVDDAGLFESGREGYVLCLPSGATGRVVTRDGTFELGPHATRVPLDDSARGKVRLGKSTTLFQFVIPPPRAARAQLPLATKHAEIDWALTVIVAFSFLVHFGFIGSMFSDWLDPVVASDDMLVALVDITTALPAPVVDDAAESATNGSSSTTTPTHHATTAQATARTNSDARAASLAHEAEAMQMSLLSVFSGTTAVAGALNRSEIPLPDLDLIARDPRGAEPTSGSLHLSTSNGIVPGSVNLHELGMGGVDPTHAGHERTTEGPKVEVTTEPVPPPPNVRDVEGPIARLRPSFRSCYVRKGLDLDPTMQGRLVIDIHVAPNGEVSEVTRVDGTGLSPAVEQCIIERAHNASFSAPGGSGAHVRVPVVFKHQ